MERYIDLLLEFGLHAHRHCWDALAWVFSDMMVLVGLMYWAILYFLNKIIGEVQRLAEKENLRLDGLFPSHVEALYTGIHVRMLSFIALCGLHRIVAGGVSTWTVAGLPFELGALSMTLLATVWCLSFLVGNWKDAAQSLFGVMLAAHGSLRFSGILNQVLHAPVGIIAWDERENIYYSGGAMLYTMDAKPHDLYGRKIHIVPQLFEDHRAVEDMIKSVSNVMGQTPEERSRLGTDQLMLVSAVKERYLSNDKSRFLRITAMTDTLGGGHLLLEDVTEETLLHQRLTAKQELLEEVLNDLGKGAFVREAMSGEASEEKPDED